VAARPRELAGARALPLGGHHPDLPPPTSFEAEVDRLATMIAPASHVAGYSLGARLALGLAVRHPGRVARLTLFGVHPGLVSEEARASRRRDDERWARLLSERGVGAFADAWEAEALFAAGLARASATASAAVRDRRRAHHPAALASTLRALSLGVMPVYALPPLPTLLVAGTEDHKFAELARTLAGVHAATHLVAGAGHDLLLEAPATVADCLANPWSNPWRLSHA